MAKYRIRACAVCGLEFERQQDRIECLRCHTVYDLINGKIDNSRTYIAPMDCKHRKRMNVCGAGGTGFNYDVTVCEDCGEMSITGSTEHGRHPFHFDVVIWSRETAEALAKPSRLIEQS